MQGGETESGQREIDDVNRTEARPNTVVQCGHFDPDKVGKGIKHK